MAVNDKLRKKKTKITAKPIPTPTIEVSAEPKWYPIDWNKVKTLEDAKIILKNMGLGCQDTAPNYEELKKYLSDIPQIQL